MSWWYGTNISCPFTNGSLFYTCANGHCINHTLLCDKVDHCGDNSDEDYSHAHCYESFQMSGTIIAGLVIGTVVGIAILCCVVGTVVDCFVHIYKYWCSCLNKAYRYQTEMVSLRTPRQSPSSDPSLVVVRALPPNYSTIVSSPTDSATAPMLPNEDTNHQTKVKKKDLMVRVSRVAIRDCIPDIETDSDEELDDAHAMQSRNTRQCPNRPKDLVIRNAHSLLTREFDNIQFDGKREFGVDTHDLQDYQSSLTKDNSKGTSTRDLTSLMTEGVIPKKNMKTIMVSRDMQTEDVVSCLVPVPDYSLNNCPVPSYTSDKSSLAKSSYCPASLPPSYSSIFINGNMMKLDSDKFCCNGVVDLPPKPDPDVS